MKSHEAPYKEGFFRRACQFCDEFLGYKEAGMKTVKDEDFSHGMCPPCFEKEMEEMDKEEMNESL